MPKTDISVRELVDKVAHGELLLPEMQRRYVWAGGAQNLALEGICIQ